MKSVPKCLCFILCYAVAIGSRKFRVDYDYYPSTGGWFKLHRIPATWHEARLRCDLEGAVLASPLDANILDAMKVVMSENLGQQFGVFSGIHATFSKGYYFSIEGVPIFKIPISWAPDEPDNYEDSESCQMLLKNGTMADVKCTDLYPYICYKKKSTLVITGCGTSDPEYVLDSRTGSCYKFHSTVMSWSRAYMTCAAEGGYLSIVNSYVESQVLKDIFALHPTSSILYTDYKNDASIGFQDWGEHGTWRTIHGETLDVAGFSEWYEGNPRNSTHDGIGQYCGAIARNGRLTDIWCNGILFPFICEKDPRSLINDEE